VFDVDPGKEALLRGQYLELVLFPVAAGLEDDAVEIELSHLCGRYFDDVVRPREIAGPAAVPGYAIHGDRKIEVVRSLDEVEKIAPMHVPGEYSFALGHAEPPSSAAFAAYSRRRRRARHFPSSYCCLAH
jgi:hypothetical protein